MRLCVLGCALTCNNYCALIDGHGGICLCKDHAPESTSEGAQKVREEHPGKDGEERMPTPAPGAHRDSTAVGEPRTCATCGHPPEAHIYNEGECRPGFTCPCGRFAPTPEPATATVTYEPGPTEQLRRGFDEEGPHDLLCDCPPCCAYHAATQNPEPATATGSGEAKCDRCFNRYPVLFSMCRPCMDEVAPPSIQPPGDGPSVVALGYDDNRCSYCDLVGRHLLTCRRAAEAVLDLEAAITRARAEGRAEALREAIALLREMECSDFPGEWRSAVESATEAVVRLAATPDGGAAKGTR